MKNIRVASLGLVVAACAAFAAAPLPMEAAPTTTIWLTLKVQGAGTAQPPPNHEFQLNNYSSTGAKFTATTPLDGSSAFLLTLGNRNVTEAIVRLDGQSIDTGFIYRNCDLKSDSVTANASAQMQKLSFTCQAVMTTSQAPATPTPVPLMHVPTTLKPIIVPLATATPKH